MNDNQLFKTIIGILNTGFASLVTGGNIPAAPSVKQSYQPVQQGALTTPVIYLYKISDNRLGSVLRTSTWDNVHNVEVYTEIQQYESTFQASCWAAQTPANTSQLTSSDLVNYAASIMQSAACITTLEVQGLGVYKVQAVRNPSFLDDRDRFEFAASFDFTITHKQIIVSQVPTITETVIQIDMV